MDGGNGAVAIPRREEQVVVTPGRTIGGGGKGEASWMAAAVALSVIGMAFHTVREFGYAGLWSPGTGMIPVAGVQGALLAVWLLWRGARPAAGTALVLTAFVQLAGGAIVSVLPLPVLPFEPEQSLHHYLSHAVFGIAQVPLLVARWRRAGATAALPRRQHA